MTPVRKALTCGLFNSAVRFHEMRYNRLDDQATNVYRMIRGTGGGFRAPSPCKFFSTAEPLCNRENGKRLHSAANTRHLQLPLHPVTVEVVSRGHVPRSRCGAGNPV